MSQDQSTSSQPNEQLAAMTNGNRDAPDEPLNSMEKMVCALLDAAEEHGGCKLCGDKEHTDVCAVPLLLYWLGLQICTASVDADRMVEAVEG